MLPERQRQEVVRRVIDVDATEIFNPWKLDDPTYSPDNFYTKSTDGRGFRAHLRVAVDPSLAAALSALVAQQVFPDYRTTGDIVRDALVHRMHYLAEIQKSNRLRRVVGLHIRLADVERLQREMDEMKDLLNRTKASCESAVALHDWVVLDELLEGARNQTEMLAGTYRTRMAALVDHYEKELPEDWHG